MRLHSLSLSAFGSFGGTESIDFDGLADAGLFLLHGPTGAGKTTVLDAISFALFGTVAGVRPAGGLRSHHAETSAPTEVRLEVTLDGRRFRIVRRPRQVRPKQRGEGTIEDPPRATVQELVAGAWVPRAAKPNEADPYLQEHLHMGVNQFHQIVMLPQGEFARFLRANADERRLVLEELFATQRFAEVERWLRDRADRDGAVVADADARVRDALVAAAAIAEVEPFSKDQPLAEAATWLSELLAVENQRLSDATKTDDTARAGLDDTRKALDLAKATAERQARFAAARAVRSHLDERADEHTAALARREAALRAAPVLPLIELFTAAGARSVQASDAAAASRLLLAQTRPDLGNAERAALSDLGESALRELAQVTDLFAQEQELDRRDGELEELTSQVTALEDQLGEREAELDAAPQARACLGEELHAAGQLSNRGDDLATQVKDLTIRHQAAAERDQLLTDVEAACIERDATHEAKLETQQAWLELLEAQLSSRAAALAEALEDGHPCPVCGSPDHPQPATGELTVVTDHDVAAAKDGFDRADTSARRAATAANQLEVRLAAASAIAGDSSCDELGSMLAEYQQRRLEAAAAGALVPELEARVVELDIRTAALAQEIRALRKRQKAIDKKRSGLEGALTADRERVERARNGSASLMIRADHLEAERQRIGDLIDALDQLAQADQSVLDALEQAQRQATQRGFDDVTEAADAALGAAELTELAESIEAYQRALSETDAELRHPDLMAAAALEPIDVDLHQAAAVAADLEVELASIIADASRKACDRLAQIQSDVARQLLELGPTIETYEASLHLAQLASGDDRQVEHRMRLSTYVLAARLEQVAAAASERLGRMSNGRYSIVHTDEAPDGRRKGGLGLRIIDAWTSTERETSTLSGGESFFTSLALALGVADVVGAESGGVTMETMFIDEGFGSLDDDTLQEVMDVLDGLRSGGRTIGIVSHVGDLRTRIASQLEVIKTSAGSRLHTTATPRAGAKASTAA